MTTSLASAADLLRSLHQPGAPLVLPNVWDAVTAREVERAGFAAIATSSSAVADSLGYADGDSAPPAEILAAVRRISGSVGLPVTADLEAGYGLPAGELVAGLLESGAVGLNLEDTDHSTGGLRDVGWQAERIAAVRAAADRAGVGIVINARIDVFLGQLAGQPLSEEQVEAGVRRAESYLDAGADCVYPIGLADEAAISTFVAAAKGAVNVLRRPGAPELSRLAELGVARVSLGGGLMHVVLDAFRGALAELR